MSSTRLQLAWQPFPESRGRMHNNAHAEGLHTHLRLSPPCSSEVSRQHSPTSSALIFCSCFNTFHLRPRVSEILRTLESIGCRLVTFDLQAGLSENLPPFQEINGLTKLPRRSARADIFPRTVVSAALEYSWEFLSALANEVAPRWLYLS